MEVGCAVTSSVAPLLDGHPGVRQTKEGAQRGARWLTVEEAAQWIGVGRTTVYGLIETGDVSTVHVGRKVFVPIEALEAYREQTVTRIGVTSKRDKERK